MLSIRTPIVLVLATLVAAACDEPLPTADGPVPDTSSPAFSAGGGNSGPSARGHINMMFEGALQTISFHAREAKDGSVRGSFEVLARA
ncbi:MAG: hypothetical protein M8861_07525, partial [marine benthic group bacterium]|nr:hypothetical protein [Gemmatimonadota bacterium]